MPWTRRQVRYLESSGSPLTAAQKDKMNAELHADPSLGHKKKGSPAMKKESTPQLREMRIEIHRAPSGEVMTHIGQHLDGGMEAPRPEGSEQEEESEDEPT
jgi:hypothetical protein